MSEILEIHYLCELTHNDSGRKYVWVTADPGPSPNWNKDKGSLSLYADIQNHGEEAFTFEMVDVFQSKSEANKAEDAFIAIYSLSCIPVYNIENG